MLRMVFKIQLTFLFMLFTQFMVFVFSATIQGDIDLPEHLNSAILTMTELSLTEVVSVASKTPLEKHTNLQENGHFEFKFIPEGSYILSVSSIHYNLQPFKTNIRVSSNDKVTAYLLQGANKLDALKLQVPHPVRVMPNPKNPTREYTKKRSSSLLESGPIATILNNPLYLGGIIVICALTVLPILLEKFDPETAQFMKEQKMAAQNKKNKAALEATSKFQQKTSGALEKISQLNAKVGEQNIKNRKN